MPELHTAPALSRLYGIFQYPLQTAHQILLMVKGNSWKFRLPLPMKETMYPVSINEAQYPVPMIETQHSVSIREALYPVPMIEALCTGDVP